MQNYFHGWRRKAGVVTMVMALTVTTVWIRSRFIVETFFYFPDEPPWCSITLSPQGIRWERRQGSGQYSSPRFFNFGWDSTEYFEADDDPTYGWEPEWSWQSCGFLLGNFQLSSRPVSGRNIEDGSEGPSIQLVFGSLEIGVIPYWSLAIPLTLLSGYLLFSNHVARSRFGKAQS